MVARKMVDLSLLENIGTEHRRRSGLPCHRMVALHLLNHDVEKVYCKPFWTILIYLVDVCGEDDFKTGTNWLPLRLGSANPSENSSFVKLVRWGTIGSYSK